MFNENSDISTLINANDETSQTTTMDTSSLGNGNITNATDAFSSLITSINTSHKDYLSTTNNGLIFLTDSSKPLLDTVSNATVSTTSVHPDIRIHIAREIDDDDTAVQVLVYVFAVVMFYGLILIIALMGVRTRKHRVIQIEDDYAALIDHRDVVRSDTTLRQKMNVLRLSNVQNGYMLDMIPEHDV